MMKQFLRDENGQTTVEYILIIGVIVVVITAMGSTLQKRIGDVVNTVMDGVKGKIQQLMSSAGGTQ